MSMKVNPGRWIPLALIALVGVVVWWNPGPPPGGPRHVLKCADPGRGCAMDVDGRAVKVALLGELKPLSAFEVRVEAPWARKVEARFTMESMDMGFNLYTLRPAGSGVYQARVTLPVCVTGRRDWLMELDLDGTTLVVPFVTDL